MRKSKYLVFNSFYFNFNDDLSEIKEIKELFENQNILDLERFDKMKIIIKKNFFANENINFIYLPVSIEKIGEFAFYINQIKSLDLSNCINLNIISDCAFKSNQIKQLKLPQNIETIDAYAFKNNQIKSLDLSNCINLNIISDCAFKSNQIKQLKLPKNIEVMYKDAFKNNKIEMLDLSNCTNLKLIDRYAFVENPLNEIKILDNINFEYYNYTEYKDDLWKKFVKYYHKNDKKAGDYKLENNQWQWYPL